MLVVKAFAPGLVATLGAGKYQFKTGLNTTKEANCARNGFHAAENPLDCLNYYRWDGKNEFRLCEAGGDIHEDGYDSRISCTELIVGKRLALQDFVAEAVKYILKHPNRPTHSRVKNVSDITASDYFTIVRGKKPSASGEKGCLIAFIKEDRSGKIVAVAFKKVGDGVLKPNVSYSLDDFGKIFEDGRVCLCNAKK